MMRARGLSVRWENRSIEQNISRILVWIQQLANSFRVSDRLVIFPCFHLWVELLQRLWQIVSELERRTSRGTGDAAPLLEILSVP